MATYLELPDLNKNFPFRTLHNSGNILTTPHWHKEIEIILVTKGTINLGINDTHYIMEKNEAIIINGGEVHYILASPGSERIVFQFDSSFFNEVSLLEEEMINPIKVFNEIEPYSYYWEKEYQIKLINLLKELYKEDSKKARGYHYSIKSKLYEFLIILIRNFQKREKKSTQKSKVYSEEILQKLSSIFIHIEDNYNRSITLENVADIVGYSTYYFTRFFKKNTGKTFISFLNEYRIDKAKWILINEEDITITEVIDRVGFNSKTFYRLFKKQVKKTPLEYQKIMLKKKNLLP